MDLGVSLRLAVAAILFLAVGCDANEDSASESTSPVARCSERFLQEADEAVTADARRYVEVTYCKPFDARGWVYDDGTLSIDAYLQLESGGTCASGTAGEPARTIPCEDLEQGYGPRMLDCAALQHCSEERGQGVPREAAAGS